MRKNDSVWIRRSQARRKVLGIVKTKNGWKVELECGHSFEKIQKTKPSFYFVVCPDCLDKGW